MDQPKEQEFKVLNRLMVMRSEIGYQRAVEVQHISNGQLYMRHSSRYMAYGIICRGKCRFTGPAFYASQQRIY